MIKCVSIRKCLSYMDTRREKIRYSDADHICETIVSMAATDADQTCGGLVTCTEHGIIMLILCKSNSCKVLRKTKHYIALVIGKW